jgi:NAD(P)-dependent dehydrogenase (short-subunit alcohol dehydrogenase family)
MTKNTCVITGCNSGIGKATAIELCKQGFEVIMLVRDSDKSRLAYDEIRKASNGSVVLKYVDLSSIKSIKKVSKELKSQYEKIDVLINNAGLIKRTLEKTGDDFEMTIAVNYVAAFVLTLELLPLLNRVNNSRIINVTSELYKNGQVHLENNFSELKFNGNKSYSNSKLLVVYFTKELSSRLAKENVAVNCVHPGVVGTDVFREYPKLIAKLLNVFISKPSEGAKPLVYLATSNEVEGVTGNYFYKTNIKKTANIANDSTLSRKIWEKTEELICATNGEEAKK